MSNPAPRSGVLLINLGTPDSPNTSDVRRYLRQFLSDRRVLDIAETAADPDEEGSEMLNRSTTGLLAASACLALTAGTASIELHSVDLEIEEQLLSFSRKPRELPFPVRHILHPAVRRRIDGDLGGLPLPARRDSVGVPDRRHGAQFAIREQLLELLLGRDFGVAGSGGFSQPREAYLLGCGNFLNQDFSNH